MANCGGASPRRPWRYTAGGVACTAPGCRTAVCPATSRLDRGDGEIAWSTGNLQQAARVADWTTFVLAEERARRPGWSSTSGRARVFTTPRTPGPWPTAREGWADARG